MSRLAYATHMYVGVVVPASIIIPVIPALKKYRQLSQELKVISWYLFAATITSIINNMLGLRNVNNMPGMHVYTLLEFILLALFYRKVLDGTNTGNYVVALIPFFALASILNTLFFQNIYTYNTYTKSIEAIIIIVLAIAYFRKNLDKLVSGESNTDPVSYINSGLLLYFSGSFIWFTVYNMTVNNVVFGMLMWSIDATFLLILYILIAIALWKYKK